MHKIFFGLKRAYHGTLRVTRRALARVALTPARFDLVYIMDQAGGEMSQRELQKALGVAASTVSRMLKSLEELGFVSREVMLEDFRRAWVQLTGAGRRSLKEAIRALINAGHIQLMVDTGVCPDEWHNRLACRSAVAACDRTLHRLRNAYGDVATLIYPATIAVPRPNVPDLFAGLCRRAGP